MSGTSGSSLLVGVRGGGGVSRDGRLIGRGKKGIEGSTVNVAGGGGGGGGGGDCHYGGSEEGSLKDRMRQLEMENLRLRFRVADLEGQVRRNGEGGALVQ